MYGQRSILVVDDEANLRKVLSALLRKEGYEVHTAENAESAWSILRDIAIDVVLTDLRMPGVDGMVLLKQLQEELPKVPVVMLTAHGTVDTAVEAMKLGAFDYLTKPFDAEELRIVIGKAAATAGLRDREPHRTPTGRYGMVGRSQRLEEVFRTIDKVAASPSTVLITGESGTGKELIAEALHKNSPRYESPFIKINAAAIPRELIESELFGYEKGAFTGATGSKPGRFELADGGTLFLDEIGTIPAEMQVKLLRALQESEFERVGGVTTTRVDVRLVAATNIDLRLEADEGRFREDLFYRLNVVSIRLPPLRDRRDDIPLLADHFVAKYNERLKKEVDGLESAALQRLLDYRWPGNIRELENVIERAILFAESQKIAPDDLPEQLAGESDPSPRAAQLSETQVPIGPLKEIVRKHTETLERDLISRALEETGGNVTRAARRLQISRKSLQNKMREFGLRSTD